MLSTPSSQKVHSQSFCFSHIKRIQKAQTYDPDSTARRRTPTHSMSCRDSTRPKTVGPPGRRPGDVGTRSSSSSSLSPPPQQQHPPPPHRRRKDFPGTPARFFGNTGGQCRLEDPGTSSLRCTDKACSHRPALVAVVAVSEPSFSSLSPFPDVEARFALFFFFFIYIYRYFPCRCHNPWDDNK